MTSSIPLFWRLKKPKYQLIGSQCLTCKGKYFPPRNFCPACRRKGKIADYQFSGAGTILTHSVIRAPPEEFEGNGPYGVGIIQLAEGPAISGQIVGDLKAIATGKQVRAVFRRMYEDGAEGQIVYGLKWAIVDGKT